MHARLLRNPAQTFEEAFATERSRFLFLNCLFASALAGTYTTLRPKRTPARSRLPAVISHGAPPFGLANADESCLSAVARRAKAGRAHFVSYADQNRTPLPSTPTNTARVASPARIHPTLLEMPKGFASNRSAADSRAR